MRHQPNAPRKVIAVDLDEVLARTSLAVAEFHNDTYGTSLTMDDFISYDYTQVWGGTREESIAKWRLFFDSPYFLKVEPVEGSLETLKLLKSRRFSLVIVTARQQFVADLTKKFVDRHFPGIFESIYFANHFLTEQEKITFISKPKSVICRDVHAQLLIDDSLENAVEVARAGIPVLLFDLHGAYKWNKLADGQALPDKVTRVKNWKEVQAWFPRPRSPLSTLCISRDDQISENESDSDDEDEEIDEEDEEQQLYGYQHRRRRHMETDSDSEEDLEEDEANMNEVAKREQQDDEEEDHHGRTLRRRKLMMMDFSISEDDEDIDLEDGENMDSDEQDFDLESGHGRDRRISHDDLERYRHQHETMYTGDENGMEIEMDVESCSSETTIVQVDDDMERGILAVTSSKTMVATTTTTTATAITTTISTTASGQVSIAAAEVDCHSTATTIPLSPEDMAVESLAIRSPPASASLMAAMEEVPLA
ncbi:hypothetical protein BC939DRAFT_495028 [Gamsiella multidivaricata]|uniref:uncharacterized protein n=1 Tax=Gamsiella multidivaricata TaxID=101098 RepID=UPI00222088A1|nr:uncharacterized protein BC939DRAFT_495028 [Gamsiella multidivaricata]KAG0353265.1 hypothetical protein BGZ54_002310 [Gamsiella multidivaricata]KAI7819844.1 hypothetical protein BC939DRAFT_495028 [Gamsiella multidivaricata]